MRARQFLRMMTPPLLREWRLRLLDRVVRYHGFPKDWAAACLSSGGYDDQNILARVAASVRTVVAGGAAYERDSVLFKDSVLPYAVVAALLRSAMLNDGKLQVVDFGGSLGSTYRQCRRFISDATQVDWWVLEQMDFVALGRREFADQDLHFANSFEEMPALDSHAVILACSVLQYLEKPAEMLVKFASLEVRHLVIDRTPVSQDSSDRLCIQHVPKTIYAGSYPCWIFSHAQLLMRLAARWKVLSDFPCIEGSARTDDGLEFEYRGLILEKIMTREAKII